MSAINKRTEPCHNCGKTGKYGVFGRYYCKECYDKRPKRGKGHGGLIALPEEELDKRLKEKYDIPESYEYPFLLMIPKGNKVFASLYLSHYPNSKGIVGRSINYLVIWKDYIVGIIGGNSPPYSIESINNYFNITKDNRTQKLRGFFNNDVFRLIIKEKNLGTKTLKSFRNKLKQDYKIKYGEDIFGMITFVEPPRIGAVYKADNWKYLGMTKGFGTTQRSGRWENRKWVKKQPKYIFAINL